MPASAADRRLARAVRADTLQPRQQPTPPRVKTATAFRQQCMLKHPGALASDRRAGLAQISDFHSRAEHLHAALLEADPGVYAYVPQPFRLKVHGRSYTPDCYVASDTGPRRVVELKPGGELGEDRRGPLTAFFADHGMHFEVVSAESVYAREVEAENWVEIVRILHQARDLPSAAAEDAVLETIDRFGECSLGDLVDPGDRARTYAAEIAVLRLLHRGHLRATLTERPLDFDTGFARCA